LSRLFIWCEVVCRGCSCTTAGRFTSGQIPKREMRSEARRAGWILVHGEAFCGKECLADFEKELAAEANVEHNAQHVATGDGST